MTIVYTWYIPDTLTKTDPTQQGPTVALSRDGLSNVVIGTSWAVNGVADDGTTDFIASHTDFDDTDPASFVPFDNVTADLLKSWLLSAPDGTGRLNRADQEGQLAAKIKSRQSTIAVKALNPNATPPAPAPPPSES